MRVRLQLVLDCSPDAAWELLRSPAAFASVSSPLVRLRSLEPGGFPQRWSPGEHRVALRALGLVPLGEQIIAVSFHEGRAARIMTDAGGPQSGILAAITSWRHRMAVAPSGDGRTRYRDELEFRAGALTPVVALTLLLFWRWRGVGLRRLARRA